MNEPLDYCRVKKIDEKGFGFLKSLYYEGDIFFHFSQIKRETFLEKLQKLKRGDFFIFYTSFLQQNGKRKVLKIWYGLDEVPENMLESFAKKIIEEFNRDRYNMFDLIFAFEELKKLNALTIDQKKNILSSKRILNLPTTIYPHLDSSEKELLRSILNLDQYKNALKPPFWYQEILEG